MEGLKRSDAIHIISVSDNIRRAAYSIEQLSKEIGKRMENESDVTVLKNMAETATALNYVMDKLGTALLGLEPIQREIIGLEEKRRKEAKNEVTQTGTNELSGNP